MKTSYSIFAFLLSIICILYLIFYPKQDSVLLHSFSAKVLAKETTSQDGHGTISDALALSPETTYQEHIAAHDKLYYYISFRKNIRITLTSASVSKLKVSLLSDTGKNISYRTQTHNNMYTLTPSIQSSDSTRRIFLCLTNQSASSCTLKIRAYYSDNSISPTPTAKTSSKRKVPKKHPATAAPNPRTTPSVKTPAPKTLQKATLAPKKDNKTTSNPKRNTTDNKKKNLATEKKVTAAMLYPQFITMKPNSAKTLSLKKGQKASEFIWLSSNPLSASVSDGKVKAIKEGIAIIYIREKNHPANTSSCFVRVLE